jgi:parallel beta helix pectate lyase-like protein
VTRPWTRARRLALLGALSPLLLACVTACTASPASPATDGGGGSGATRSTGSTASPAARGVPVCGHTKPGPRGAPSGAVTVRPGDGANLADATKANPPGTTFWLAPGSHHLGDGAYDQIEPKAGDTYLGAPGAVLDGRDVNQYAFTGKAEHVTIRHLTVRGFVPPRDEGVVNHDSANGWTIEYNTISHNAGAGTMAGAHQKIRDNCLADNGQYGFNAYQGGDGITGLVVEGNEITGNNTGDWESKVEGCGCSGGAKFWAVDGADVRGNWVHDNRGTGLWADTNDNDFLIENNVIEDNDGAAIIYEISYNAVIRHNTIRHNNMVDGKAFTDRGDNFPAGSVYISESGGEPRLKARTKKIDFYGNAMIDNWNGVTVWENADRYCNSPANTSGDCTRLVADKARCAQPAIEAKPLRDDCRWKSQYVDIHDNRFSVDPTKLDCDSMCARMALLSNYGTYPDWSPYKGGGVQDSITFDQHNTWRDNAYVGPWTFTAHDPSEMLQFGQWQASPYRQDESSTLDPAGG